MRFRAPVDKQHFDSAIISRSESIEPSFFTALQETTVFTTPAQKSPCFLSNNYQSVIILWSMRKFNAFANNFLEAFRNRNGGYELLELCYILQYQTTHNQTRMASSYIIEPVETKKKNRSSFSQNRSHYVC